MHGQTAGFSTGPGPFGPGSTHRPPGIGGKQPPRDPQRPTDQRPDGDDNDNDFLLIMPEKIAAVLIILLAMVAGAIILTIVFTGPGK